MQNYNYNPAQPIYPQQGPNAVSINIYSPQAYGAGANTTAQTNPYYSMYGQNPQPNMPGYPNNYNNLINQNPQPLNNSRNITGDVNPLQKTPADEAQPSQNQSPADNNEAKKTKEITPLTDDYIKSLENYLNNPNPKVRLIAAKDILERFKEDENRKDNPSLTALLNKVLRDTSVSVRFAGLTALQVGYCVGNDETIEILKQIQNENKDKIGEDSELASEILLKLSAGKPQERELTQKELEKLDENKKQEPTASNEQQETA